MPRIRLRLLRHKWKRHSHSYWLLMLYPCRPFVEFEYKNNVSKEHTWMWDHLGRQRSSFNLVVEYYDKKGGCVLPAIWYGNPLAYFQKVSYLLHRKF
jgi:hypothetical protein